MMALRDYVDEGPVGKRRLPKLTRADLERDEYQVGRDDDDDDIDEEREEEALIDHSVDLSELDA
jgi:hypothetical protein